MPRPAACKDVSLETRREITRFLKERSEPGGKLKRGAIADAVREFGRCRQTVSNVWKDRDTERAERSARGRPVAGVDNDAIRAKLAKIAAVPPAQRKTLRTISQATGISKTTVMRLLNLEAESRAISKAASAETASPPAPEQEDRMRVTNMLTDETEEADFSTTAAANSARETLRASVNCSKRDLRVPDGMVSHKGACHCGAVAFEFVARSELLQIMCNCSMCKMKQNVHAIVPAARFRLQRGKNAISQYTFNTHQAKHLFCKRCGVESFFIPRTNPDGIAVTVACVDQSTVDSIKTEFFDGEHWEQAFAASDMAKYSKV